jgi:ribosomal protein L7/L12
MGDVLILILPVLLLAAVLWALSTALKPRNNGMSEAERYQQDLARRSQAHYAAQVQAATAARARIDAATRPSQNEQQQTQQQDHARAALLAQPGSGPFPGHHGYPGAVLPGGQLDPQLAFQLQSLVRSGHKIQAIKLLRQATHSDLLTAKQYVDRL